MRTLYQGSRIPDSDGPVERLRDLRAEHADLRSIFMDLERDREKKIPDPQVRAACAISAALADIHCDEVIEEWGEDYVLQGACAVMLTAVRAMIDDPKARFGDNSIWPRLSDAVSRTEPVKSPDNECPCPV